jgi:hypothetical protein
VLEI